MIKKVLARLRSLGENDKIVYKNVIGAFVVKGAALFVTLYTMPSYIRFFNDDEVLGLWFTILSILNWILNFDLGIGNGLRNHLSTALSLKDKEKAKGYVSSAYFSIGIIVVVAAAIFPIILRLVDLNSFLSISESRVSADALYKATVIVIVGVLLQFWLRLINAVLYALQKSSVNNFLVLCTNVITLLFARYYPSGTNDENLIVMAVVHAAAVALPLIIASVYAFGKPLRESLPSLKHFKKEYTKQVLSLGGIFFFVQIAYLIIMSTNEFLVTKTVGNEFNVDYQAYYKLFSLGSTVFALALTPVWSVITKAQAENNMGWIKSTYKKFMALGALFCLGEFAIIPFMDFIMEIWLGEEALIQTGTLEGISFALLGSAMVINGVLSSIANGIGKLKTQAICFGIGAVLKIPLAYILVELTGSWLGVVYSNIICMGAYCIVQPIVFNKTFKTSKYTLEE